VSSTPPLSLGEPVVAAVSAPDETRWGFTQFPAFAALPDGRILLMYADAEDASETHGEPAPCLVSSDQGQSWQPFADELVPSRPHFSITPAYDGEFLVIPAIRYLNVRKSGITVPEPVSQAHVYGTVFTYRAADFSPEVATYLQRLDARRWTPATGKWQDEQVAYDPMDLLAWRRDNSDLIPRTFFERPAIKLNGELLYADYRVRYATYESTFPTKGGTTLMASADNGRSFQRRAIVALDPTGRDLYGEPALEQTTDGGLVAVIRKSDQDQKPMAITHSQDAGRTWSPAQPFGTFGVFPYLLRLDSGVIALSYGRPGVWLQLNLDGNGRNWSEPIAIIPGDHAAVQQHSCGYTSLHAIGPRSFLLAYSDFEHRHADGTRRKAIVTRRIDVAG
jgi:hypothetical protein